MFRFNRRPFPLKLTIDIKLIRSRLGKRINNIFDSTYGSFKSGEIFNILSKNLLSLHHIVGFCG